MTETKDDAKQDEEWGWSFGQRVGLGILLSILMVVLAVQYFRWGSPLEGPVVKDGEVVVLPARMDPNVATLPELMRIPHFGEKVAARVVEYREARRETAAGGIVFRSGEDLGRVPGVNKGVLQQVLPYLEFPEERDDRP
jgi:DNA uptake protein ComE-like DNA-binding protein